jgi:hypothetical protein
MAYLYVRNALTLRNGPWQSLCHALANTALVRFCDQSEPSILDW